MDTRAKLGKYGENKAASYLKNKGYHILERNYRYQKAEIDLIAKREGVIAIIEVKTRSGHALEHKTDAINRKKIQRLVTAADQYLNSRQIALEVRFDIIWITRHAQGNSLEHIKNAFYHF